jgi:hypothetical protein
MSNLSRLISGVLAATCAALFAINANAGQTDGIFFRNGDVLYGQLLSVDGQKSVRWRHPDSTQPIDFKADAVAQIDFPTPTNSATLSNSTCKLVLANGDSLNGELISCDRDALTIQTWYAGRLKIPRNSLQTLAFIPSSPAVFAGITGLEGWTQDSTAGSLPGDNGKWIYRNGAFYASKTASIARDVKLPDVSEIQFDLAWKGTLNLAVALYTDSLRPVMLTSKDNGPAFGGFYSLRFQTSSVDLWPIKKGEPFRPLGQLFIPSLITMDRVHVDLRVSKPRHRFALYLDDTPVKEWDDPTGFVGEGTCLRFVQNPGGSVKLSNLRVAQWDGIFEEESGAEATDTTHDILWPADGIKITGSIDSIVDGKLSAHTTNGLVELPLEKIKAVDFAHRPVPPAQVQVSVVKATFAQGGDLTFILESWRPDEIIAHSPDLGKIRINPAAFIRLQFLVAEKKADEPKS